MSPHTSNQGAKSTPKYLVGLPFPQHNHGERAEHFKCQEIVGWV
jgi:hypothetical protein